MPPAKVKRFVKNGQRIGIQCAAEGVAFHVFCYNVQPGIQIDYATGKSEEIR